MHKSRSISRRGVGGGWEGRQVSIVEAAKGKGVGKRSIPTTSIGNTQEEDDSPEVDPMKMVRPLGKPREMDHRRGAASEGVGEVAWGSRVE